MTHVVTFHEQHGTAPAWMASVIAINQPDHDSDPLINHAVVLVAANSEHEAEDKALNVALRTWLLADGWNQHHAVVSHLSEALQAWWGES